MEFPRIHPKSYQSVPEIGGSSAKSGRTKIVKNLVVLSGGTLLLFTAYDALTMLQSTMNRQDGVGVTSQATLYVFFCISAIFLPTILISRFGSRNTSVAAMFAYLPYIASNYRPHWIYMIPSSIVLGIAGPILWASFGVYLNGLSLCYSAPLETKSSSEVNEIAHQKRPASETDKDSVRWKSGEAQARSVLQSCERQNDKEKVAHSVSTSDTVSESAIPNQLVTSVKKVRSSSSEVHQHSYYSPCADDETKGLVTKTSTSILSSTTARFFGIHGMAHLTSHVWGSLLSYFTLKSDIIFKDLSNSSCSCGPDFCSVVSECFENNAGNTGSSARYTLTTICVGMCVLSILIAAMFLDDLEQEKRQLHFSFNFFNATCAILKRNEMMLLIPLSVQTGLVQGFYVGDFNKAYVACAWGTHHVGLVAACYGAACGASSLVSGWLVARCGRRPVLTSAGLVIIVSILFLLLWTPDSKLPNLFFLASGLWGIHVGIVWSQLRAFYGVLFKPDNEAAFSAFHFWSGLGFCVAFASSSFFCISHKLYALLAVSVLGFAGYHVAESLCGKNKDSH